MTGEDGRLAAAPAAAEPDPGAADSVEQTCPVCGRGGFRSLANHTVKAHRIYAAELRELLGLGRNVPLCSPELSDLHRHLAREQETIRRLDRPEVRAAAAATREANYDAAQRRRRVDHLRTVRPMAVEAFRRGLAAEKANPELAAVRRVARSKAHRQFRPGAECSICGAWFCSAVPPGRDYRQRKFCTDACYREAIRRLRRRTYVRRTLATLVKPSTEG